MKNYFKYLFILTFSFSIITGLFHVLISTAFEDFRLYVLTAAVTALIFVFFAILNHGEPDWKI